MKEQAARGGADDRARASSTGSVEQRGGAARSAGRRGRASHDAQLAEWYRVLDLSAGADMSQIKTSYRQLMRKYHPDMHAGNPQQAEGGDRAVACVLQPRITGWSRTSRRSES